MSLSLPEPGEHYHHRVTRPSEPMAHQLSRKIYAIASSKEPYFVTQDLIFPDHHDFFGRHTMDQAARE
jgi:hypothetical protein